MLLLAAAALSADSPNVTIPGTPTPSAQCPRTTSHYAVDKEAAPPFRRLSELPDANAYKAVYRTVGGCEVPVLVKYKVSGRR